MQEPQRIARNKARLEECNPKFRAKLLLLIPLLESNGFRPRIQDAWRSGQAQMTAYKSGNSDLRWGLHNCSTPAGLPDSLAVDLLDDDNPKEPPKRYIFALAHFARQVGLETGIMFRLPRALRGGVERAIADWQNADPSTKIGYDPTHVQWPGILAVEAKAGKRP